MRADARTAGRPRRASARALAAALALMAVVALLVGPLLPTTAHALAPAADGSPACAMHAPPQALAGGVAARAPRAASAPSTRRGGACALACALCGQLWVAPVAWEGVSTAAPERVRYARAQAKGDGVTPEAGTPPPR